MPRPAYSLLLWLALPLIVARLWWRGRKEPGYRLGVGERFGYYSFTPGAPVIWLHAVSVGEVRACAPLVNALLAEYPNHRLLVTCMTAAGRETIGQVFGDRVLAAYLPYDYPFAVRRFLDRFRPSLGILMETEIWINLLAECRRRSIGVVLANGRMSARSAERYRTLAALTRAAFEALSVACAQSESDANRLASLGVHKVIVCGNLKFDVTLDRHKVESGVELRSSLEPRKALMLASTREGEEALLLEALQEKMPEEAIVLLVPRHPQRFDEVARLIDAAGISYARRSRGEALASNRILLGDTMGEMAVYYAASEVAIIGGTLLPFGGQNLIEASASGVAVVIGPHVRNFSEAARLAVECGAAVQVEDARQAVAVAIELMLNAQKLDAMQQAGLAFASAHRGATERHLEVIKPLLPSFDSSN